MTIWVILYEIKKNLNKQNKVKKNKTIHILNETYLISFSNTKNFLHQTKYYWELKKKKQTKSNK